MYHRMLWISFYRPKECFRGAFNNFAAWWTNGDFCHCELVVEASAEFLFEHVQQTYVRHMRKSDARSKSIVQEIERTVMEKYARRMIHHHKRGWISFSLLFGDQLRLRVLDPSSNDAWHQTPAQTNDVVVWKSIDLGDDALAHIYNWALEEIGKPYDNTGALFSWMPSIFSDTANSSKHFCSEFCTRALQRAGQLHGLHPAHTTPNKLYKVLQNFVPTFTDQVGLDLQELVEEEMKSLEKTMDTAEELASAKEESLDAEESSSYVEEACNLSDLEAMMESSSDEETMPADVS